MKTKTRIIEEVKVSTQFVASLWEQEKLHPEHPLLPLVVELQAGRQCHDTNVMQRAAAFTRKRLEVIRTELSGLCDLHTLAAEQKVDALQKEDGLIRLTMQVSCLLYADGHAMQNVLNKLHGVRPYDCSSREEDSAAALAAGFDWDRPSDADESEYEEEEEDEEEFEE